jgi:hypothetical protein
MAGAERKSSRHDERTPEDELPEAFKDDTPENAPKLKEVYKHEPADKRHTSTGLNIADEGSEESFPASDPPSSMPTADPS